MSAMKSEQTDPRLAEIREQGLGSASMLSVSEVIERLENAVERNPHIEVKYAIWNAIGKLRELDDD